ncbi:MAG: hypothetical protein PHH58_15405, partial [Rhodoferax sp.]|nr:hypothetical protein [Rhodoferax sp.]
SSKNLSNATCHVIDSYGKTAGHAISAYQAGGQRVLRAIEVRWNQSLSRSRSRLGAGVARNASSLQQRVQHAALTGLSVTSGGAQSLVKQIVYLADIGVHSVADNALWLQDRLGTQALTRLSQVAVPAVTKLGTLASQLELQSAKLARRVAGKKVAKRVTQGVRTSARKPRATATTQLS